MKLKIKYEKEDIKRMSRELTWFLPMGIVFLTFGALFLLINVSDTKKFDFLINAIALILLGGLFVWLNFYIESLNTKKLVNKFDYAEFDFAEKLTVREILNEQEVNAIITVYHDIEKIKETKSFILIVFERNIISAIPKRALTEEELTELKSFLKENVEKTSFKN